MRLVARNARKGAQFTPQGILKYPLTAATPSNPTDPMKIMADARALLDAIQLEAVPA
jgi:transcription-repair coupling factor (superfamily II helicase)